MVLRIKNLNILGVHWKIQLIGGRGGSQKTNIEGGGLPDLSSYKYGAVGKLDGVALKKYLLSY